MCLELHVQSRYEGNKGPAQYTAPFCHIMAKRFSSRAAVTDLNWTKVAEKRESEAMEKRKEQRMSSTRKRRDMQASVALYKDILFRCPTNICGGSLHMRESAFIIIYCSSCSYSLHEPLISLKSRPLPRQIKDLLEFEELLEDVEQVGQQDHQQSPSYS